MKKPLIIGFVIVAIVVLLYFFVFKKKSQPASEEAITSEPSQAKETHSAAKKPLKRTPLKPGATSPVPGFKPKVFSHLQNSRADEVRTMLLQVKAGDWLYAKTNGVAIREADNTYGTIHKRIPKDNLIGVFKGFARNNFLEILREGVHDKIYVHALDVYVGHTN